MRTQTLLTAVAVALLAASATLDGGQRRSSAPATLTAADYIEIQQLAVRYTYALDTGADGGEMFAALFAPDGTFVSASRGPVQGHDALVALGRGRNPMFPRRFIVTHLIEPTGDGAIGRVYVVEVELPSDGEKLGGQLTSTGGRYEEVYERTPSGWRFKRREFLPSKMAVPGATLPPARGR